MTALFSVGLCYAQGQDSTPTMRDLAVISTLLEGGFDNANQAYFDGRLQRQPRHAGLHLEIEGRGENRFAVTARLQRNDAVSLFEQTWSLAADNDLGAVRLTIATDNGRCDFAWQREAAQFRALPLDCDADMPTEIVLSEKQLWITLDMEAGSDYQLHRVRRFECYADIPGVGGGRDEPYDRYDGLKIHDQGGAAWFTSKEGRELGISLFLVDWPINNYEGVFTRDSFVIYVSERVDGERKELGYAFTVPEADRLGINLKWMLASCFMKSNKFETPFM